uniref:ATP synthase subunit 8 n=1 Tax=Gardineria hawaiiensis TaxID=703464 RepID=A0A7T1TV87_9CNID|nr:ATP synthase F0 subunit 8 [Gardineria hawaiiensis]QPP20611.1 ATP synthase subunit 8 [Gardineria hawaiiensis]
MPQLDTATYLTQYRWTLLVLFLLFFLLVFFVLPTIKINWLIRKRTIKSWAVLEGGLGLIKEVYFCLDPLIWNVEMSQIGKKKWKVYM